MSTTTPNLGLVKPELQDNFNLKTHLNDNWDKIDQNVVTTNNGLKGKVPYRQTKNLINVDFELGTISSTTGNAVNSSTKTRTADFVNVEPNTKYTLTEFSSTLCALAVYGYDVNGNFIGSVTNKSANYSSQTFTTGASVSKIKFWVASTDLTKKFQLEVGSISTPYTEPLGMEIVADDLSDELIKQIMENGVMNYLYVSNDYTEDTDGFGVTKFKTIKAANDSIIDNSETNRYTIKVADGTYTDLQELYSGFDDSTLGATEMIGVNIKNYVYYEGNVKNPSACVIKWDGATGFDKTTLVYANVSHKCPFHCYSFKNDMHYAVRGFTFDCKNLRYCFHTDSAGGGYKCDWTIEDCIFKWGGTPDCTDNNNSKACWGCGHSPFEAGKFLRCKIIPATSLMGYQNHDSGGGAGATSAVVIGAKIVIEDCNMGGTIVQARSMNGKTCDINNIVELKNCINISRIDNLHSGSNTETYWTIIKTNTEV